MLCVCLCVATDVAGEELRLPDWLEMRWDLQEELTGTRAADGTFFDPEGELVEVASTSNILKLDTDLTVRLGAGWSLKSRLSAYNLQGLEDSTELEARELYLRGSLGPLAVSAGRKILRWSNGYAFSPAGLLDPLRAPTDPSDRLGLLAGRDLLQLDLYRGDHTWTLVYSTDGLFTDPATTPDSVLAVRYNVQLGDLDLSAIYGVLPDAHDKIALSSSFVSGSRLELHAEIAGSRGADDLLPSSIVEGNQHTLFGNDYLSPVRSDDDSWFLEYLLGINYTFGNGLNLVAEYFHSDIGLSASEWERYTQHVRFSQGLIGDPGFQDVVFEDFTLPEVNVLQAARAVSSQASRRDYLFLRLAPARIRQLLDLELLTLVNLGDDSAVAIAMMTFVPHPRLSPYLRGSLFLGSEATEYGSVPQDVAFNVGVSIHF